MQKKEKSIFRTNTAASFRRQFKLSHGVSRKSLAVIQECRDCSSAFTGVKCEHIMTASSSLTEDKQRGRVWLSVTEIENEVLTRVVFANVASFVFLRLSIKSDFYIIYNKCSKILWNLMREKIIIGVHSQKRKERSFI